MNLNSAIFVIQIIALAFVLRFIALMLRRVYVRHKLSMAAAKLMMELGDDIKQLTMVRVGNFAYTMFRPQLIQLFSMNNATMHINMIGEMQVPVGTVELKVAPDGTCLFALNQHKVELAKYLINDQTGFLTLL